MYEPATVGNY